MLAPAIVSGLLLGSLLALVAAGLNLIFGTLKIINIAHGQLLMIGMFIAYWLNALWGMDPYLTFPIVFVSMFGAGYAIEKGLIEPILESERITHVLITFGLALVLQNTVAALWSHDHRSIQAAYTSSIVEVAGIRTNQATLFAIVGSIVSIGFLYLFLNRTRIGTAIRAVSQNADSAELAGIDVRRIYAIAFAIGTAMVGIAAVFMAPIYSIHPEVGLEFGIMAFIIVVLGGLGNVMGAAAAGLIIGLAQNLFGTFLDVEMARAFAFFVFLGIIFFRPSGIFGTMGRV